MDYTKCIVTVQRSDGQTFVIDNEEWKIPSDGLVGFDYADIDVSTEENAYGDGSRVVSVRIPEKDRSVTCHFRGTMREKAKHREEARYFFNPFYTYRVIVEYMGVKKYCEGNLYDLTLPTANVYEKLVLTFTVLCTQPYLLSYDDFAKNVAGIGGGLEFNFDIPVEGTEFGEYVFSKGVDVVNKGDVYTYCKAVFKIKGTVEYPRLIIGSKFVELQDTLELGDELVIDLVSKPAKVTVNGKNRIGMVSQDSSFNDMKIEVGTNTIKYDAVNGDTLMDVILYYNERYLGM